MRLFEWLRARGIPVPEGLADGELVLEPTPEPAIAPVSTVAPAPVSAPATPTPAPVAEPPAPAPVSLPVAPVAAPQQTSPHLPAPAPPQTPVVPDNPMDFDKDLTDADVARYVSLPIEEQIRYEDSIRKGMARTNVNIENVGRSSGWVTYQGDKVTIK